MPFPDYSRGLTSQLEHFRAAWRQRADCTFVEPDEFARLVTSCCLLVRADDWESQLLGVLDRETGQRFLVERERITS
jgi:hypothetical protein